MTLVNAETGEVVEPLSASESAELTKAEQTIERGLATFVEVGDALAYIRDEQLYRASHGTFEAYCQDRWGMERRHAYRLIEASEVTAILSPIGHTPTPANEAQARPLTKLKAEPEEVAEAWGNAVQNSGGKPTAADVADAVAELQERKARSAEDRQAIRDLEAELQPAGFDRELNARLTREGGALSRLCRDIAAQNDPDQWVADHANDLPHMKAERVRLAEAAFSWLDGFLTAMEDQ